MNLVIRLIGASVALSVLGCGQPATPATPTPPSPSVRNDMNKNPNLRNLPPEARQQIQQKMGGTTQ
jgi:hypothetical protein